jgi:hypothetical protein
MGLQNVCFGVLVQMRARRDSSLNCFGTVLSTIKQDPAAGWILADISNQATTTTVLAAAISDVNLIPTPG